MCVELSPLLHVLTVALMSVFELCIVIAIVFPSIIIMMRVPQIIIMIGDSYIFIMMGDSLYLYHDGGFLVYLSRLDISHITISMGDPLCVLSVILSRCTVILLPASRRN